MKKRSARTKRIANAIRQATASWSEFLSPEEVQTVSFLVPNAKKRTVEQIRHYLSRPDIQHRHFKDEILSVLRLLSKAERIAAGEANKETKNHWQAFHQDIEKNPDDEGIQDIYADWREEKANDPQFREYLEHLQWYKKRYPQGEMTWPPQKSQSDEETYRWLALRKQYHGRDQQLKPMPKALDWYYHLQMSPERPHLEAPRLEIFANREFRIQRREEPTALEKKLYAPTEKQPEGERAPQLKYEYQVLTTALRILFNQHKRPVPHPQRPRQVLTGDPSKEPETLSWTQDQLHDAVKRAREAVEKHEPIPGPPPPRPRHSQNITRAEVQLRINEMRDAIRQRRLSEAPQQTPSPPKDQH
jgi:hypothetical protein